METNVQEELCQGELPNFGVSERTIVSLPTALSRGLRQTSSIFEIA